MREKEKGRCKCNATTKVILTEIVIAFIYIIPQLM